MYTCTKLSMSGSWFWHMSTSKGCMHVHQFRANRRCCLHTENAMFWLYSQKMFLFCGQYIRKVAMHSAGGGLWKSIGYFAKHRLELSIFPDHCTTCSMRSLCVWGTFLRSSDMRHARTVSTPACKTGMNYFDAPLYLLFLTQILLHKDYIIIIFTASCRLQGLLYWHSWLYLNL
jgi:hypothetical protein